MRQEGESGFSYHHNSRSTDTDHFAGMADTLTQGFIMITKTSEIGSARVLHGI